MDRETLTIETLPLVDGGQIARDVNHAISQCARDVIERPALAKARRCVLQLTFEPQVDENTGELLGVDVSGQVRYKVPDRCTMSCTMQTDHGQGLLFDPIPPEEVHQPARALRRVAE